MGKKKRTALAEISRQVQEAELFAEFDSHWDEKAFAQLDRSDPMIAQTLARMVDAGIGPKRIMSHMLHKYPHLWLQTQALLAAVRHLESESDSE